MGVQRKRSRGCSAASHAPPPRNVEAPLEFIAPAALAAPAPALNRFRAPGSCALLKPPGRITATPLKLHHFAPRPSDLAAGRRTSGLTGGWGEGRKQTILHGNAILHQLRPRLVHLRYGLGACGLLFCLASVVFVFCFVWC